MRTVVNSVATLVAFTCSAVSSNAQNANLSPLWGPQESWSILSTPVLEIGVEMGPEHYQFSRIRGGLIGPDGLGGLLGGVLV